MNAPLDEDRLTIARHILAARQIARKIDAQILDYLLEMSLEEIVGHLEPSAAAGLRRTFN